RLADLPLLDHPWQDPRRVARRSPAGARDHRLRLHPADPYGAGPARPDGARHARHRAIWWSVRRDRPREPFEPARRESDLPVRDAPAILPRRDLQPDPEPAAAARHPLAARAHALRG